MEKSKFYKNQILQVYIKTHNFEAPIPNLLQ